MGGKIEYQPAPGGGSVFSFSLPLAEADLGDLHALPAPESRPDLTGRRILVADDTPANLMVVECLLAGWGAEVVTATDGKEAVAAAAASPLRPCLSGSANAGHGWARGHARAARCRQYDAMPVVALTAQSFPRQREHALAAGFTDFVSKPLRAAGLAANLSAKASRPDQPAPKPAAHPVKTERLQPTALAMVDESCAEIGADAVLSLAQAL